MTKPLPTMLRCPILFVFVALQHRQTALSFTPSSFGHAQRSSSGPSSKSSLFFNFWKPKEDADAETAAATATEPKDEDEGYYDEDDPVEKIFGFFFGKKEQAPLG
jgi:hypothetical protein